MLNFAFVLLLLSWLNPLHIGPWISWHNEALAFAAGVLFLAAALRQCLRLQVALRVPRSALAWLVLAGLAGLQALWGQIQFGGDALVISLYGGLAFAGMVAGFNLSAGKEDSTEDAVKNQAAWLVPLAAIVVVASAISSVLALVQTLDVWEQLQWIARTYNLRRPGANLGQPNQLATLLLMGIVSLNYLYGQQRLHAWVAGLVLGLLIAGLGLTESRSGILGAAALLAFMVVNRKRALAAQPVWPAVAGFVFLLLCFRVLPWLSHYVQQGGLEQGVPLAANLSVGSRLTIWPQLLEASFLHPWWGWGLHQTPMAHNAVLHQYPVGEAFTFAHCIVLDLVLGLGYPLALAVVGIFAYWFIQRCRGIARSADATAWYGMAMLIPLLVHSLLEFPFAYAYFLLPVAVVVGVMEARLFPHKSFAIPWQYASLAHVCFVGVLLWSVWEYLAAEEDFRVARFEALRIGKVAADYQRPNLLLLTQLQAALNAIRVKPAPGMDAASIDNARKAALRYTWPATQNRYALTLALNGNPDEAVRQLQVLRAMHGEKSYQSIKASWKTLAEETHPQLKTLALP
jgi:hypothetical protein